MSDNSLRKEVSVEKNDSRKTVCVIGGGVAALVSAKVLLQDGFAVTVFEKESTIGGVWAESRAYPGLRSNNPHEAYAFSDFDYPETADEFPTAGQIRDYLESYAGHFGLWPHICLQTGVISVSRREPAPGKSHHGFRVRVRRWTQKVFPRRNSGYSIGAYISCYIDELMKDMGLRTKRTGSFFREYRGAFWANRYKEVAEERRQLRPAAEIAFNFTRTFSRK